MSITYGVLEKKLAAAVSNQRYWFRLMRREQIVRPRFSRPWQGWNYRLSHLYEDITECPDDGAPFVVGCRFVGWRTLLFPTRTHYEDVPRGAARIAVGHQEGAVVDFGYIDFGKQRLGGVYERMQMSTTHGVLLAEISLLTTLHVKPGDKVTVHATIGISC